VTESIRYSQPPVELPLDAWMYDGTPVKGCATCAEAASALEEAKESHNASKRFEAGRIIRAHPHVRRRE
jgi:hypothetical protein